jgi:hypothetical protein
VASEARVLAETNHQFRHGCAPARRQSRKLAPGLWIDGLDLHRRTAALQRDGQHQRTQGVEQRGDGLDAGDRGAQHGRAALRLGGQRLHALLEFSAQQGQQGLALLSADVVAALHAPSHSIHRHAGGVDRARRSPACGRNI